MRRVSGLCCVYVYSTRFRYRLLYGFAFLFFFCLSVLRFMSLIPFPDLIVSTSLLISHSGKSREKGLLILAFLLEFETMEW